MFANIVLADEINRSSPKTQASLLECMEERQATIDNVTHAIVAPFMVVATQNPIEYEGTYPLPEAQLDRFMMRLSLGYPSPAAEEAIVHAQTSGDPFVELEPVLGTAEVLAMQDAAQTRRAGAVASAATWWTSSPPRARADTSTSAPARAPASPWCEPPRRSHLLREREYVVPQDVKDLAGRVLSHRIILSADARVHEQTEEAVIAQLLDTVPVPRQDR